MEVGSEAGGGGVCTIGEDGSGRGVKGSGQGCMEDKGMGEKVGKGGGGRSDTDVFVGEGNVVCKRFWSRWECKGSEGVNELVREWRERNWVVPSLLLLRVPVEEMVVRGKHCVLVVPNWAEAWLGSVLDGDVGWED